MSPSVHASSPSRNSSKHTESIPELDLFAGLWQEAPFVRLPPDAPPELLQYVEDIEDPRRVYAIHRASRRHDFQLLVERFIHQLRQGCGVTSCLMPTCFTCRKRLAGKSPLRRYNVASARTLALYLASRDNPEDRLCAALRQGKDIAGTALTNLLFDARPRHDLSSQERSRPNGHATIPKSKLHQRPDTKPSKATSSRSQSRHKVPNTKPNVPQTPEQRPSSPTENVPTTFDYVVGERPANKDHRSFAANVFGTVAFRMLEWLTPQGHASMKDTWTSLETQASQRNTESSQASSITSPRTDGDSVSEPLMPALAILANELPDKLSSEESSPNPSTSESIKSRRNSEALLRTSQHASKPHTKKPLDPLPQESLEEPRSPTLSSKKSFKTNSTALPRNVVDITKVFENTHFETPPNSLPSVENKSQPRMEEADNTDSDEDPVVETKQDEENTKSSPPVEIKADHSLAEDVDYPLPQTLSHLNTEIIDFIYNTFDEDRTSDNVEDEFELGQPPLRPCSRTMLKRRRSIGKVSSRQWKAFNEQTLFHVLSHPESLVRSFTENGRLIDSSTLYNCMQRLIRVKSNLVYHSLWIAAESLFYPPGFANVEGAARRSPRNALNDFERGCILSICLHALISSVPVPSDNAMVGDLSLIRSQGLTLSYFGHALKQPAWLMEQYDEAFSNDAAIRLARRLCRAVIAQHAFAEKSKSTTSTESPNVVSSVIKHMTIVGARESKMPFDSDERLMYDGRVQLTALDWARTVLFNDWNGTPIFATDGPFAGALTLMKAMYDHRPALVVGDSRYCTDYFSDRLDALEVAIEWLDFRSTKHRQHLLDYPYVFSQERIISYFRSINFSRMSRTFEESSSLKTRMKAILERGSLITNPHHKTVLQELLKTASAKYLVLQIRRESVLKDAFDQLWRREERELLRPLKVRLGEGGGEEGFDSGGVQQEFFRLAIAECLDPNTGAFVVDDRTRMAWFAPGSLVEPWRFEMMGLLVSLAVFNGLTLPVTFPKALYSKLLGWPVRSLGDIEDGWPDLVSGLESLLEWNEEDGKVEDIFARTYEFSVFSYGSHVTKEMTSGSSSWPQMTKGDVTENTTTDEAPLVTAANREAYVADYVRYLTDVSVQPQFAAFERGFRACLVPKSLKLLDPPLLQSLVEGVQEIDISELRRYTRYVGWDATHQTVRDFWSIVKRYDENMKRRLLEFVTASDRLPVGGVQNLQFVVQKNGYEEDNGGHLPTAYTCYGTLLLPEYKDKDSLRARLSMALENAQGFGFA